MEKLEIKIINGNEYKVFELNDKTYYLHPFTDDNGLEMIAVFDENLVFKYFIRYSEYEEVIQNDIIAFNAFCLYNSYIPQ